jgi:hypothetical protein
MFKHFFNKLIKRYGTWKIIHATQFTCIAILALIFLFELIYPVSLSNIELNPVYGTKQKLPLFLQSSVSETTKSSIMKRKGLFKPSTPLRDKPIADSTIEKIKSQLKLQCIMIMNKEPIAYINIKGVGLRKCKVGDNIHDIFTLVGINKNNVEITIIGHKVILGL